MHIFFGLQGANFITGGVFQENDSVSTIILKYKMLMYIKLGRHARSAFKNILFFPLFFPRNRLIKIPQLTNSKLNTKLSSKLSSRILRKPKFSYELN